VTRRVLIVGHADADGHLIAEQVRRNLALVDAFDVKVVVDPMRTRDHRSWLHLDAIPEIDEADYVFFVDLMFAPDSFAEESDALTQYVKTRPEKRFFLIDHHPLPLSRLEKADNLRVCYRSDVCECAIGPRTGMMVVAALCERKAEEVAAVKTHVHKALCVGMRRAAAIGGPLSGKKLLTLLGANMWDSILRLSDDDPQFHRLPRGLRPSDAPCSNTLNELDAAATELLNMSGDAGRNIAMARNTHIENEELTYEGETRILRTKNGTSSSKDLEVIKTLLEVAALSLTPKEGSKFKLDQWMNEAQELTGNEIKLDEKDVKNVVGKARFVKKVGKQHYQLR
jgi:hypothetical protein